MRGRALAAFAVSCLISMGYTAGWAQDSPVTIVSDCESSSITIGDTFIYRVDITYPEHYSLLPVPVGANLGQFVIRDYTVSRPRKKKDVLIQSYTFTLTTFFTGKFTIEPFEVTYVTPENKNITISSQPIPIEVVSVNPDESEWRDIRDIKPPVNMPVPVWPFALAGIAGGGALAYWFGRKKRLMRNILENRPLSPPDEMARQQIRKLTESALLSEGRVKEYYIALSEIIRQYIERRFDFSVLDRTTYELYREMRRRNIDKEQVSHVRAFLEECDMVKFARYVPGEAVIEKDTLSALAIIDMTSEREKIYGELPKETAAQ